MKAQTLKLFSLIAVLLFGLLLVPSVALAQDDERAADSDDPIMTASADQDDDKVRMEDMRAQDGDVEVEVEDDDEQAEADTDEEEEVTVQQQQNSTDGRNWAGVIGRNAFWGGITGGLVGLGAWLVTGRNFSPWYIAQFAGGGILVGAAIGVVSLATMGDDQYANEKSASVQWIERDMPKTYDVRLLNFKF